MKYYAVVYERPGARGGNWSASVPDLPGLTVTGDTHAECEALMAEGIPFHIEGLIENGDPIPARRAPSRTHGACGYSPSGSFLSILVRVAA